MLAPGAQSAYDARQAKLGSRTFDVLPAPLAPRGRDLKPFPRSPIPRRERGATTLRLLRLVRGA